MTLLRQYNCDDGNRPVAATGLGGGEGDLGVTWGRLLVFMWQRCILFAVIATQIQTYNKISEKCIL